MKKLLLSLGALSAVVAPVAAVVACGSDSKDPVTPAKVDAKTLESNEVWNQTPGTRVFHVGWKVDGAAKHKTAGTVTDLVSTKTGSYGFHGLFGFLKHATRAAADATMFAKGDKVVITTKEGAHTITIDTAAVTTFKALVTQLRALDADQFSALDADKHAGTPLAQAQIVTGTTIQTKALEDLLALTATPALTAAEVKEVKAWASFHEYKAPAATPAAAQATTFDLTKNDAGAWHSLFKPATYKVGDVLKINALTYTLTTDDVNSLKATAHMSVADDAIATVVNLVFGDTDANKATKVAFATAAKAALAVGYSITATPKLDAIINA